MLGTVLTVFFLHCITTAHSSEYEMPVAASDLSRSRDEQVWVLHRVYPWPGVGGSDALSTDAGTPHAPCRLVQWQGVGGMWV